MSRLAKIRTVVTYYVENMPADDADADTYADESSGRISELVEGLNGVIEGSVTVIEWEEIPEEATAA